jgi:hypothetical protein
MNVGEILVWETTNTLLLIPVLIALVILTRWIRRLPLFTDRDWLFLTGNPREKVLSVNLWLRFAALWVAVVLIGFVEGYVLLPFGLAAFLGAVFLTALVVWRLAPKYLRHSELELVRNSLNRSRAQDRVPSSRIQ